MNRIPRKPPSKRVIRNLKEPKKRIRRAVPTPAQRRIRSKPLPDLSGVNNRRLRRRKQIQTTTKRIHRPSRPSIQQRLLARLNQPPKIRIINGGLRSTQVKVILWSMLNYPSKAKAQKRFDIWKSLSYPTLAAQSYSDFEFFFFFRTENQGHTACLIDRMPDKRFKRMPLGPGVIRYLTAFKGYKRFLVIRIDSDDTYHPKAVEWYLDTLLMNPDCDFIQCTAGYFHNVRTSLLYHWKQRSPPFYAFARPPDFISKGWSMIGMNHQKLRYEDPRIISRPAFVVNHHDSNALTTLSCHCIGRALQDPLKKQVQQTFKL